jgi:hypothetical protein
VKTSNYLPKDVERKVLNNDHQSNILILLCPSFPVLFHVGLILMEAHISSYRECMYRMRESSLNGQNTTVATREREKAKPSRKQSRSSGSQSWNSKVGTDGCEVDIPLLSFLSLLFFSPFNQTRSIYRLNAQLTIIAF